MSGKRITALVLAAVLASTLLTACQEKESEANPMKETISIPAVTVDLQAPENRVQVSEANTSWVTDENGNRLSDSQWLLNSKIEPIVE